jgi:predicted lipoprotein with Yx(FWY)xxD motif
MENELTIIVICLTFIICFKIFCVHKFKRSKTSTAQDNCLHDMQFHTLYEDDDYKNVVSTCTKCGYERDYEYNKNAS